ncbi:hypothetical protein V8F33_002391 [Rhypophila sp. PSN 637]
MCYQVAYTLQCEHVLTDIIYCNDATPDIAGPGDASLGNDYHGTVSSLYTYHGSSNKSKPPPLSSVKTKGYQKATNSNRHGSGSSSHESRSRPPVKGQGYNHHSNSSRPYPHHSSRQTYHEYDQNSPRIPLTSSSMAMLPPPLPTSASPSSSSAAAAAHKRPCSNLSVQSMPYPTPPSFAADPTSFYSSSPLSPRCPLRDCPFEQKQRCWNCCWCGKGWNVTGRCGCVMLIEGNQVRCEHICCDQCEPAGGPGGGEGGSGGGGGGGAGTSMVAASVVSGVGGGLLVGSGEGDPGSGYYLGGGGGSGNNSNSPAGYDAHISSPCGHSGGGLYY